ncbi:ROK family transcriptional regulator [Microbacterium sp. LRZ72]|uniref:ROK family transcriptional regulator n=1 Tax=Microbacterium sp. LRZ72 TaxID=2942481 RepID=UPI0029A9734D|nr:ROK family transcriptional regulator [Microbacterium sp. LRZ72]MDX2376527.1 ROK family transcriptional regulator [Microbacterium sp. LRZ72]
MSHQSAAVGGQLSHPVGGSDPRTSAVLRILRDRGPRSRTQLAELTGVAPTTVTKLVTPLLERGWVREARRPPEATSGAGRPAISLSLVPEKIIVGGIHLGAGLLKVGLVDGRGVVLATATRAIVVGTRAIEVLGQAAELLQAVSDDHGGAQPIAVGVAAPGVVDAAHRRNLLSINLGWHDVPIADRLEQELGIPVVIDHNVRAMALAEARYTPLGADSLAYVYVRTGVGLGLILRGEPLFGGSHAVTELGHLRVREPGEPCACGGRGCLETVLSAPRIATALRAVGIEPPEGVDAPLALALEHAAPHPGGTALRDDTIDTLAGALAVVVNLLSPTDIVLGGALRDAPDRMLADLTSRTRSRVFPLVRDAVRIRRTQLPDAGVSGGGALALEYAVYAAAAGR